MSGSEWTSYQYQPPPRGILCVFEQRYWTSLIPDFPQSRESWVGTRDEFQPELNIANLYWKLAGIGREQLDALSPEERARIESPIMPCTGQSDNNLASLGGPSWMPL